MIYRVNEMFPSPPVEEKGLENEMEMKWLREHSITTNDDNIASLVTG